MTKIRRYVDKNTGVMRTLVYKYTLPYLVNWHYDYPPCMAEVYEAEDGSLLQIPTQAWEWAFGGSDEIAGS